MAHLRYLLYAEIAEKEGFLNVARLFKAVAFSELVHAKNHYNKLKDLNTDAKVVAGTLFGLGNTSKNLDLAIQGEEFEVNEMYPVFIETARLQGEKQAEISFTWAFKVEKIHAELYKEAKSYVDNGRDLPLEGNIWVCPVCGYTQTGKEPSERCPICGTLGNRFVKF